MTMLDDRPVDLDERPVATLPVSFQAQTGRWRIAGRLARREMRRRPWRSLLSLLLIAVPVAAMVLADVAYRTDILPPDDRLVFGTADGAWSGSGTVAGEVDEVLSELPDGVASAVSWGAMLPLRSTSSPDEPRDAVVYVRDTSNPIHDGRISVVDGREPTVSGEVLLGPDLAEDWGVGVGDQLALVRPAQIFTVVGIGYTSSVWFAGAESTVLVAPGFDVDAVRPEAAQVEVLVDDPSFTNGDLDRLPSWSTDTPIEIDSIDPSSGDVVSTDVSFFGVQWYGLGDVEPSPGEMFLGWLGAVLLLGVTGVVVAAAFAVSGRRQLVTIGQLSAAGADPAVLRRYLALQGTITGAVAAAVGLGGGVLAVRLLRPFIESSDGRLAFRVGDLFVLVVTAVAIATIAAVVPTRSLARSSVLSALGGRRPVPPVRARQVSIGAGLLGAGLLVIFLATATAQSAGDEIVSGAAAVLGALGILVGVCCLCPVVIDRVAAIGSRRRGAMMLAARGLGRHRSRSAALLASVVVVAAALTGLASIAEQAVREDALVSNDMGRPDVKVVQFVASDPRVTESDQDPSGITVPPRLDPEQVRPTLRDDAEALLGPATWIGADIVPLDSVGVFGEALVADDALLDAMGVPADMRVDALATGAVTFAPSSGSWYGPPVLWFAGAGDSGSGLPEVRTLVVDGLRFGYGTLLVTPEYAATVEGDRDTAGRLLVARLSDEPTSDQLDALWELLGFDWEAQVFVGDGPDVPAVQDAQLDVMWIGREPSDDWIGWLRVATVVGALALMSLIVSIGMALWAAEGRDERDTLVAVGASPALLARTAASKAGLLTLVGVGLGVPLGWAVVRLVAAATDDGSTVFPWWFAGAGITVVPLVIAGGTWIASAIGQRARPVTASDMSD